MPKPVRDSATRQQLDFEARRLAKDGKKIVAPKGDGKHLQNIW